ncbi:TPA: non-canonical purine NTP pyrophosphatase [Candidatus Gracilibacteria bacterium]|nr:non-canonical purine NTP pyrophosphatase [Candidatus Peregrinibacteria bacterium]HIQ56953.1 non-canonical purine NTP pyrophosphatase [Candidatus Gracilibacteria bacterium]HIQ57054.1 non-canonical purine NTP pyrophosphatase [Candidatus Gracilibacteria bacterium]
MKLHIATQNLGKLSEIKNFLSNIGVVFVELDYVDLKEETGDTFQENSLQKAMNAFLQTGLPTLAEDSGIEVDALRGELGVKTRRWGAGKNATDEEWLAYFLSIMHDKQNRNARFFTSACLILSLDEIYICGGSCDGIILQESSVPLVKGIPLSSYFVPNGLGKTFSELSEGEKNKISHRGNAMSKIANIIKGM